MLQKWLLHLICIWKYSGMMKILLPQTIHYERINNQSVILETTSETTSYILAQESRQINKTLICKVVLDN